MRGNLYLSARIEHRRLDDPCNGLEQESGLVLDKSYGSVPRWRQRVSGVRKYGPGVFVSHLFCGPRAKGARGSYLATSD